MIDQIFIDSKPISALNLASERSRLKNCSSSGSIYSHFFTSFNKVTVINWYGMTICCHINKSNPIQNLTKAGVTRGKNVDARLRVILQEADQQDRNLAFAISCSIYPDCFRFFSKMTVISWDGMTIGCHIKKTDRKSNHRRSHTSRERGRTSSGPRSCPARKERSKTGVFAISRFRVQFTPTFPTFLAKWQ